MLDAGGGGGGGTPWSAMDVPTMWSTVESQDTTTHWEMLKGWRRSYELILQHMSQVRNYRENLAGAWPPEKSPASAAYLVQLDALLDNLQETYDAAVANYTAFSTATLSLSSTRTELKQIYDQYTSNQTKLDDFNAQPKPVQYGKTPLPPQKPPVPISEQEALNNRARTLMSGLSSELTQARKSIATPKPYNPNFNVDDTAPNPKGSEFIAPTIPPIVPVYPDERKPSYASAAQTPQIAVEPMPAGQPGLILGGVQPTHSIPTPVATQPTVIAPGSSSPLPGLISPQTGLPSPGTNPQKSGARATPAGQPLPNRSGGAGSGRLMAPGGVIGTVPGLGQQQGTPGSRVNPIGGVIGATPPQSPSSNRSTTSQPMGLAPVRPSGGDSRNSDQPKWDPNNPWATAQGVPPILTPSPEQKVDPGPAIGLN